MAQWTSSADFATAWRRCPRALSELHQKLRALSVTCRMPDLLLRRAARRGRAGFLPFRRGAAALCRVRMPPRAPRRDDRRPRPPRGRRVSDGIMFFEDLILINEQ